MNSFPATILLIPRGIGMVLLCLWALFACSSGEPITHPITQESTYQNKTLLEHAWRLPVAAQYKKAFEYQINGSFCGPASLVNVAHSLTIPSPKQDALFERSTIFFWKARFMGLTLDELARLIVDNTGIQVQTLRGLTLGEFRRHLVQSNDRNRYIVNFSRQPLFGKKIGHHSPIGGYLVDKDLVFLLDVNPDYGPFLVSSARLYQAMDTIDSETGKKRGLLLLATDLGHVR